MCHNSFLQHCLRICTTNFKCKVRSRKSKIDRASPNGDVKVKKEYGKCAALFIDIPNAKER